MVARKKTNGILCKLKYAAVLLLGSLLSNTQTRAAENYFETPQALMIKIYTSFNEELDKEFKETKKNRREAYFLDSRIEQMILGENYDMTIENQDKLKGLMLDIYTNALKNTLKREDIYQGLKEDILNELPDFRDEDSFLERTLGPEKNDSGNERKRNFLDAKRFNPEFKPSFKDGKFSGSASLTLDDFGLGNLRFRKGKIEIGNRMLKAYLDKSIKDDSDIEQIYARLGFELKESDKESDSDFNEADLRFSLYKVIGKNCSLNISAGYCNFKGVVKGENYGKEEGIYGGIWLNKEF